MLKKLKLPQLIVAQMIYDEEFERESRDIMKNGLVRTMLHIPHHGRMDCLSHSTFVAFTAYKWGKKLGLDTKSIIRGGLLHDFYLYDWHIKGDRKGLHGYTHPRTSYNNASKEFEISDKEKDIILKHMWPLIPSLPKYKESIMVIVADKYCTLYETLKGWSK